MLDSDTRRKIDTLRDILVGKIPNPQTQVEQITTGLIYKFMDDMDQESIEMGGEGSFFVGDYEKYASKNLLDPKLSGVDKVNLYSQAIEGMYLNPSAPQLFRDIFKNAFLPFKDPSTLNMFLKEINEFHYSHWTDESKQANLWEVTRHSTGASRREGYCTSNLHASYVHLYFPQASSLIREKFDLLPD